MVLIFLIRFDAIGEVCNIRQHRYKLSLAILCIEIFIHRSILT